MSTLDEISGEIKQKTQGAVQFVQQAQHLFEYFAKLAGKEDSAADRQRRIIKFQLYGTDNRFVVFFSIGHDATFCYPKYR